MKMWSAGHGSGIGLNLRHCYISRVVPISTVCTLCAVNTDAYFPHLLRSIRIQCLVLPELSCKNLLRIILATASTMLTAMTPQPNTMQATAGIVLQLRVLNFTKHSGGRMYANAHALVAPMSSNTAPRSQVIKLMATALVTSALLKIRWRLGLYGSSGNQ